MEEMKVNLLLKKKLLLIELKSIDEQLNVLNASTTVIDEPEGFPSLKSTTSPVQTATGKDSTNPLKADVWLKNMLRVNTGLTSGENSKLVNSSPPTLGKGTMTNLSTNTLVQEPVFKPDYLNAAKLEAIRYYVIYKGPRAGVYTNWGEVSTICQEDKSTNKKFKSREQADKEFFLHGEKTKETKTP
nr:hypothetical protein [Tanacetum cinerariifolium]